MNIEVKLRALISDQTALSQLLEARAKANAQVTIQNRFLVDYSTYIEGIVARTKDIRFRFTNGQRGYATSAAHDIGANGIFDFEQPNWELINTLGQKV